MTDLGQEFRNENADSHYPFADDCTLTTTDGLELDPGAFIDASLYPIGNFVNLRLASIERTAEGLVFTVGDDTHPVIATAFVDPNDIDEVLEFSDTFGRFCGVVVCDPDLVVTMAAWSTGLHEFKLGTATFVTSCCFPAPASGILGFELPDGQLVTGDAWLIGENGVTWSALGAGVHHYGNHLVFRDYILLSDRAVSARNASLARAVSQVFDPNSYDQLPATALVMNVVGEPLFKQAKCSEETDPDADPKQIPGTNLRRRFVRTLSGVAADQFGDMTFDVLDPQGGHTILRVESEGDDTVVFNALGKAV